MKKTNNLVVPCILLLILNCLFLSCDLLRDSPYVVEGWTPGEGSYSDPSRIRISLLMSHQSDREKTEQAFSLSEDRKNLKGDFSWEGSRLVFLPSSPLEVNRDYIITLGTGAQDTKGLSLENKFEASFTTRPAGTVPRVTGIKPEYEGCFSSSREELRLYFSCKVPINSCFDHISISPSMSGSWYLEDGGTTACFVPREPWEAGVLYRIRVDNDFQSVSGAGLGSEYTSVFYGGSDRNKPVLERVSALVSSSDKGISGPEEILEEEINFARMGDETGPEYSDWESFTRLELVFSKAVDLCSVKNLLATEPQTALVMESMPEFSDRAVFRFAEYPQWGHSFLFRLSPGVTDEAGNESREGYTFRVIAGGPLSKPPVLAGIRLPMAPGNAEHEEKSYTASDLFAVLPIGPEGGHYPYSVATSSWIELYFETAPGAEIDLFSVMDLFRVETTNQALHFSPRSISIDDLIWPSAKDGWEKYYRVEIRGLLTNTVQSGVVTFRIPSGLKDTRGNRSISDFRISLLK